jgi:hypothetical protein
MPGFTKGCRASDDDDDDDDDDDVNVTFAITYLTALLVFI